MSLFLQPLRQKGRKFIICLKQKCNAKCRHKERAAKKKRHKKARSGLDRTRQSNRNSLHFSIYLAVGLLIAAVADVFLSNAIYWGAIRWIQADRGETAVISWQAFEATGLGNEDEYLILIAPLMLLFSYNRVPRWKKLDSVIPALAFVGIILLLLEGSPCPW